MERRYYLVTFIPELIIVSLMYVLGMSFLSCVVFALSFSLVQLLKHPNINEYKTKKKRASFVSFIYFIDEMLRSITSEMKALHRWQDYFVAFVLGLVIALINADIWSILAIVLVVIAFELITYWLTRSDSLPLNSESDEDLRN